MKKYIPKSKSDIQAVEYLQSCPFDIVRPDVPHLLEWLQDLHWDVSHGVAEYLLPHINEIKDDLISIFKLDDDEWKRNILVILISKSTLKLHHDIVLMLRAIAEHPTKREIEEDVYEEAKNIIAKNYS